MNTVEVLAEAFRDMGTPFIVGHPGGDTVHLMDAARKRDMRYILMKQEVAGAILAATWGEITGSPGVCTSNPWARCDEYGERGCLCLVRPCAFDCTH